MIIEALMLRHPTEEEYLVITMSKSRKFINEFMEIYGADHVDADWMITDVDGFVFESLTNVVVILFAYYTEDREPFAGYVVNNGRIYEIDNTDLDNIVKGERTTPHYKNAGNFVTLTSWT